MSIEYKASNGEKIRVPVTMDPYKQLGITCSTSPIDTKKAVWREMMKPKRQDRAMASLAYHMITSSSNQYKKTGTIYEIKAPDIFFFAAIGHREKVIAEIEKDPSQVSSVDELKRTVVYLAARCGFSDIVETLVRKGADVNHKQLDNSTPLHVAAFYGQKDIVTLLLVYGADPTLKNKHGNTPVSESSDELKKVFEVYKKDPFQSTVNFFDSTSLTEGNRFILYRGKKIGIEIFRSKNYLDDTTKRRWNRIKRNWEVAYHGTKHKYIKSILTYGLLPSGAKLPNGEIIKPPSNHFQLGMTYAGVEDWARALFVSPSIMYASHQCYSEHTEIGDSQWFVVVKVFVNPSSYKAYNPTVLFKEQPIDGEPDNTEYRVEDSTVEDSILRIFSHFMSSAEPEVLRNAVVASVMFIDLSFRRKIRDYKLNHADLRKLFC